MFNVCMYVSKWLFANKHLVSKFSIHRNQVPVLFTDVSVGDRTQNRQFTAYGRPSLRWHKDIRKLCTELNHIVAHQ